MMSLILTDVVDAGFGVSLNQSQSGESEFWAPIRRDKRSRFSGQPKLDGSDSYIGKQCASYIGLFASS